MFSNFVSHFTFNQINFKFEAAVFACTNGLWKVSKWKMHVHTQTTWADFHGVSQFILSLWMNLKLKFRKSQLTFSPDFGVWITLGRFNAMTVYVHSRFHLHKYCYLHRKKDAKVLTNARFTRAQHVCRLHTHILLTRTRNVMNRKLRCFHNLHCSSPFLL